LSVPEEIGEAVEWKETRVKLWLLLSHKGPLTASEILDLENGHGAKYNYRSNLSEYLNELREKGAVQVERRGTEPDLWYAVTEDDPVEQPDNVEGYETVRAALDAHFPIVAGTVSLLGSGLSLQGYELLHGPLGIGGIPDHLVVGPVFVLMAMVAIAIWEVHI